VIVVYNPLWAMSPLFQPVKSEEALDAAEQSGTVFLPINPTGANHYEVEPGNLLICPRSRHTPEAGRRAMTPRDRKRITTTPSWLTSSCNPKMVARPDRRKASQFLDAG
jgi:hypothetical protein